MKRNLLFLLPLLVLVILVEACSTKSDPIPIPTPPQGSFTGTFRLMVKKTTGSGYDTVKKDPLFSITLSQPTKFLVTRVTPGIHALSRGTFQYNGQLIGFTHSTYVAGPQTTYHLAGVYQYATNSAQTRLQFVRPNNNTTQDTLFFYDLNKTSN